MSGDFIEDLSRTLDRLGRTLGFIYVCLVSSVLICASMWAFYRYGFSSGKEYVLQKNIPQSCGSSWSRKLNVQETVECHKKLKELYRL